MTVTAPAAPARDAKAGFCSRCRARQHSLCASPPGRCGCPYADHPNRPAALRPTAAQASAAPPPAPPPAAETCGACQRRQHTNCTRTWCACTFERHPNRRLGGKPVAKVEPVWELVKAAPPAPPPKVKKPTPAELAQPMLETIAESGDRDFWRIALFGTAVAATKARKALAEAFPGEWEWTSARDDEGRPAVFVRCLGPQVDS